MGATMMLATAGSAAAGPFGIDMGAPIGAFSVKAIETRGRVVITPPNAHADFNRYVVVHHPSTGVCAIEAETDEIPTAGDGGNVKIKFSELRMTLERVYGKSNSVDSIKENASYKNDVFWMKALWERDRVFYAYWTKNEINPLKNNIASVVLEPTGSQNVWRSHDYGHIRIRYEFNNFAECQRKMKIDRMKKL